MSAGGDFGIFEVKHTRHDPWKTFLEKLLLWMRMPFCYTLTFLINDMTKMETETVYFLSSLVNRMRFVKMAVLDTSVWILHQKSISTELLLRVALHIRYFFAFGRVGAAVELVVVKALPAWVGGWLWGVTHSDNGGLHSWKRVHAALTRYFMPHGPQLKLVVVRHPYKRAPAENPFKSGPEPEPRWEYI